MPVFRLPRASWGSVAVVALSGVVLLLCFGPVVFHPGHYYFQPESDGIQSYFTTAYYALYDGGGQHFSGMNYPAGENFNYPNLQPLIAWGIWAAQQLGLPAATNTIAITNALALAALAITPLILYSILRRFQLPAAYSVLVALCITFLSPQVQRLGDHMSLSYTCFVPLLWYCILRMEEAPTRARWYALFGTLATLMGLVMLYFAACAGFFLLSYAVSVALRRPRPWGTIWRMAVTALTPLLLLRTWLWLTDPVTDRPPNPYGLLVYKATLTGVFTPPLDPALSWWQGLFRTQAATFEATAYVGAVTTLTLLGLVIWALVRWRRHRGQPFNFQAVWHSPVYTSLVAGGLLLLVAFGMPMVLPGMGWLVEYLGPLKQFRALGRFAWPFYYTASGFAAWQLWHVWQAQRQRGRSWALGAWLPLALLVWGAEAGVNLQNKASQVLGHTGAESFFNATSGLTGQLSWASRRPTDFQAVLPLPYFNQGSDKIALTGTNASVFQAFRLSVTTGLPELSSYSPRPSVEQSLRHVQLLSSPLLEKPLLSALPSRKPLLLLVTPEPLSPAEQRLVRLSRLLASAPEGSLYELPLDSLAKTTLPQQRRRFAQLWPSLPARPDGLRTTTSKGVIWQPFNQSPDRRGRLAPGAFYEPKAVFSTLYKGPLPSPADTGRYEASVWVNAKMAYGMGNLQVKQYRNTELIDHQVADGRVCTEVSGDWVRVVLPFRVQPGATRLEVLYDNQDLLADDLLIRSADTDVYWRDAQGRAVLNGYRLE